MMSRLCYVFCLLNLISEGKSEEWQPQPFQPFRGRLLFSQFPPCCSNNLGNENLPSKIFPRPNNKIDRQKLQQKSLYQSLSTGTLGASASSSKYQNALKQFIETTNEIIKKATKERAERIAAGSARNLIVDTSTPTAQINEEQPDDDRKAFECSQLKCAPEELKGPLCACNFKTGNTVSFKNECDIKKHNCRFDTEFKTIVQDVCPWQFESRSGSDSAEDMHH